MLCIAVPTPIWIAGLAGSALLSALDRTEPDRGRLQAVMAICVIGALSLPILSALAGLPFAHRYFNINIFLLCAALLLPAVVAFDLLNRSHRFFGRLVLHSRSSCAASVSGDRGMAISAAVCGVPPILARIR